MPAYFFRSIAPLNGNIHPAHRIENRGFDRFALHRFGLTLTARNGKLFDLKGREGWGMTCLPAKTAGEGTYYFCCMADSLPLLFKTLFFIIRLSPFQSQKLLSGNSCRLGGRSIFLCVDSSTKVVVFCPTGCRKDRIVSVGGRGKARSWLLLKNRIARARRRKNPDHILEKQSSPPSFAAADTAGHGIAGHRPALRT